jgi:hypothetical protein
MHSAQHLQAVGGTQRVAKYQQGMRVPAKKIINAVNTETALHGGTGELKDQAAGGEQHCVPPNVEDLPTCVVLTIFRERMLGCEGV